MPVEGGLGEVRERLETRHAPQAGHGGVEHVLVTPEQRAVLLHRVRCKASNRSRRSSSSTVACVLDEGFARLAGGLMLHGPRLAGREQQE